MKFKLFVLVIGIVFCALCVVSGVYTMNTGDTKFLFWANVIFAAVFCSFCVVGIVVTQKEKKPEPYVSLYHDIRAELTDLKRGVLRHGYSAVLSDSTPYDDIELLKKQVKLLLTHTHWSGSVYDTLALSYPPEIFISGLEDDNKCNYKNYKEIKDVLLEEREDEIDGRR